MTDPRDKSGRRARPPAVLHSLDCVLHLKDSPVGREGGRRQVVLEHKRREGLQSSGLFKRRVTTIHSQIAQHASCVCAADIDNNSASHPPAIRQKNVVASSILVCVLFEPIRQLSSTGRDQCASYHNVPPPPPPIAHLLTFRMTELISVDI